MASVIRSSRAAVAKCNFSWATAAKFSTTPLANVQKEAQQISKDLALLTSEEKEQKRKLQNYITIEEPIDVSPISHIPPEQLKNRRVRIFEPVKNAMQSGTDNTHHWEMEFDNRPRWENPLMGWSSTGDPLSNLKLKFASKDEAIEYCERNKWQYYIDARAPEREQKPKSYGVNFSWNRRTRVSTK